MNDLFYVKEVLPRWESFGSAWPTKARAEQAAAHLLKAAACAEVYDCTESPIGTLVATYIDGVRQPVSQHCDLGIHVGCPGETTLGTAPCACACHEAATRQSPLRKVRP